MGIDVLDRMILADTRYCSFKEDGTPVTKRQRPLRGDACTAWPSSASSSMTYPSSAANSVRTSSRSRPKRLLEHRRTTPPARTNANASAVETVEVIATSSRCERELRKLALIGQDGRRCTLGTSGAAPARPARAAEPRAGRDGP